MPHRLALYTFGVFIKPSEHSDNDGFHELNDPILDRVDCATGLVARSGYDDEPGPESWGVQVFPDFYVEQGDGWAPSTLSLWVDMESAMAFSYFDLHAEALKRGKDWFVKPQWPPYAVWWCDEDHTPDWKEAVERHRYLHDNGPTPGVFTFKHAFSAAGDRTTVDQARMKSIVARNEADARIAS